MFGYEHSLICYAVGWKLYLRLVSMMELSNRGEEGSIYRFISALFMVPIGF